MNTPRVTVELPAELLKRARAATGQGITCTVRRALEMLVAAHAQERLTTHRGKVRFGIDLSALREDRA